MIEPQQDRPFDLVASTLHEEAEESRAKHVATWAELRLVALGAEPISIGVFHGCQGSRRQDDRNLV